MEPRASTPPFAQQEKAFVAAVHTCLIGKKPSREKERAHFERAVVMIDEVVFNAEDYHVCEQSHLGMASGANTNLPLGHHETGIKLLHDIFDEHLLAQGQANL